VVGIDRYALRDIATEGLQQSILVICEDLGVEAAA